MTTFFWSILCVLLRYNWLVKGKIKYIHTQRAIFNNIKLHQGSHSHITVDILQWKELPEVIQSNLLLKAQPLGSGPYPAKFCAVSKNEDFSTSLDNPLLCLTALTGKIFSLVSNQNFLCSNVCLLPLMLSLCNLQGKPGSVFSTPSHQLAANCHEIPLSLLFSCVNKLSSLNLSSHFTCSSSNHFGGLCWTHSSMSMSFFHQQAQDWTYHSRCGLTSAKQRGRISFSNLLAMHACSDMAQCELGPLCCQATLLADIHLLNHQIPRSFSAKPLPSELAPNLH